MAAKRTILRNTGVITTAYVVGAPVAFTYTDAAGVQSKRKVNVLSTRATRHNPDALLVMAQDGLNVRSFRTDRMLRARVV